MPPLACYEFVTSIKKYTPPLSICQQKNVKKRGSNCEFLSLFGIV